MIIEFSPPHSYSRQSLTIYFSAVLSTSAIEARHLEYQPICRLPHGIRMSKRHLLKRGCIDRNNNNFNKPIRQPLSGDPGIIDRALRLKWGWFGCNPPMQPAVRVY